MRLLRPALLVDVNRVVGLDDVVSEDGALRIGATVRQADTLLHAHPVLAAVLPHVGHTVTRNRGTVCGSIAHADAAGELPLALVACGGSAIGASMRGRREIPAEDLFLGPYTTALAQDELLVETVWPQLADDEGFAFDEVAQRGGDYALCMAAARTRGETTSASSSAPSLPCPRCSRSTRSARASRRRLRSSRGARSMHRPTTSGTSCTSLSTASSSAHGSEPRDQRRRHREREALPRGGRASPPPVRLHPAPTRPHRDARRLRARRLRCLHRQARRRSGSLVPASRGAGGRCRDPHGRGAGRSGRAHAAPGGVPPPSRTAVRLLHARDPHRRRRPALTGAPADARGDRRHALRPALPLHRATRLSWTRSRRSRAREPRAQPPLRGRAEPPTRRRSSARRRG